MAASTGSGAMTRFSVADQSAARSDRADASAPKQQGADLVGSHVAPGEEDRGALDEIAQLADIAGPAMLGQAGMAGRGQARRLALRAGEEMRDEQGNVAGPLGQRRQVDREDAEAIEEVFAEAALVDRRIDVAMGGGDDADVDRDLAATADSLHRPFLEHAQQLHLHVGGHVADLVEEEGAALRFLELALMLRVGASEGAFLMAEKDGFEQIARDRPAIHGDERRGGATAGGVDGAGDDFLAAARRAGEQDGGIAGRDLGDEGAKRRRSGRGADDRIARPCRAAFRRPSRRTWSTPRSSRPHPPFFPPRPSFRSVTPE